MRIRILFLISFDAVPDPMFYPSFQIKAQTLEKVLNYSHILYILACHLQIDAGPDPAYHFDTDPDPDFIGCGSGFSK